MKIYRVGGAVRDKILNYPFSENDWVVTGATVDEMQSLGYQLVGKDFPVFLHPTTKEEYALARTERKDGHGYHGFEVHADPKITIEEDLLRRDLTINAIAEDEDGHLIDPFNGQQDLENKILKHVSDAFVEDPVRILRVARFASKYHHLGFTIAEDTLKLMQKIVDDGEISHLVAERVWQEIHKALKERNPEVFFEVLRQVGALKILLPEIDVLYGIPNPENWHPEIDTGIHTMMVLKVAVSLNTDPLVRFAALCHDLGKGITPEKYWPKHRGHEEAGVKIIEDLCHRLKIPKEYRELAVLGSRYHLHAHKAYELRPQTLLKLMEAFDVYRRPQRYDQYLDICEADSRGRTGFEDLPYTQRPYLEEAKAIVTAISTANLKDKTLKGKTVGDELRSLRLNALADFKNSYSDQLAKNAS